MKIRFLQSLAIVVAAVAGNSAFGEDCYQICDTSVETVSFLGGGDGKCCDDDCGKGGKGGCCLDGLGDRIGGGGAFVDVEALIFRANVENVAPTPEFAHEIAPRISVGYVGCEGLGIRFRYFDFSHDTGGVPPAADSILIDTYNIDVELFEELQIGCATTLEWSAGVRYNEYKGRRIVGPTAIMGSQEQFSGWGLTFGLQGTRCLGRGQIYGRARWAILQDENATTSPVMGPPIAVGPPGVTLIDDMRMQTEIALGYEVSRCTNLGVLTARIGYEVQFWEEYNSNTFMLPGTNFDGFDGVVLGLELAR